MRATNLFRTTTLMLCTLWFSAELRATGCIQPLPYCTTNVGTINLQLTGLDPSVANWAILQWETNCNGYYGASMPSLVVNGAGDLTVDVTYQAGRTTHGNDCGLAAVTTRGSEVITATVIIWEQDMYGSPCPDPNGILRHELGHVFGLDDVYTSNCVDSIMYGIGSGGNFGDACATVAYLWDTPQEAQQTADCLATCHGTCFEGRCSTDECFQYPDGSYSENCYSPILIDLAGHGYHLTSAAAGVHFDLNADGQAEALSWPRDGDNAFLCLDRNGNGMIDNGRELFGNYTPLSDGSMAHNGFAALAEYDRPELGGNNNGWIDRGDAIWPSLLIWGDTNHDGVSQPTELRRLDECGIVRISDRYTLSKRVDGDGNAFRYKGESFILEGSREHKRDLYDVFFVPLH
jgi:hypothetical protein